jgi:hypothetical protein
MTNKEVTKEAKEEIAYEAEQVVAHCANEGEAPTRKYLPARHQKK